MYHLSPLKRELCIVLVHEKLSTLFCSVTNYLYIVFSWICDMDNDNMIIFLITVLFIFAG